MVALSLSSCRATSKATANWQESSSQTATTEELEGVELTLRGALPELSICLDLPLDSITALPVGASYIEKRGRLGLYATRTPKGVAILAEADSVPPEVVFKSTSRRSATETKEQRETNDESTTQHNRDPTWPIAGLLAFVLLAIITITLKKILLK